MDIRKCEKGHFYEANKNKTYAQYMQEKTGNMTGFDMDNPNNINTRAKAVNAQYEKINSGSRRKNYGRGTAFGADENRTVGFYSMKMEIEPVVGWLVCVKGEEEGISFPLKLGRNFIGRGSDMDVVLKNDKVVLASERLRPYDILAVGNSELSFVPFCGPKFSWEDWDEE